MWKNMVLLKTDVTTWFFFFYPKRLFIWHSIPATFQCKHTLQALFYQKISPVQPLPQQDILPPYQHVHQGSNGEIVPAPCHQNSTMRSTQSKLGSQMVQPHQHQFWWTNDCNCCCQGIFSQALSVSYSGSRSTDSCMASLFSNKLISRNEGLHCNFVCVLPTKWSTVFLKNLSSTSSMQFSQHWDGICGWRPPCWTH